MKSRRNFLKRAGASLVGYSLFVKAPQSLAAQNAPSGAFQQGSNKKVPKSVGFGFDPIMRAEELECDVLVAGGGLAGVCAALSAARHGRKVILVQDRSRLGGNASAEVRMHPLGLNYHALGQREGGIIEELKLENAAKNLNLSWDVWDFMLYDKCVSEPNIRLIMDTSVCGAEMEGAKIKYVLARSDATMSQYRIKAKIFIDSTGDGRLALESGAEMMSGREGAAAFNEPLADYDDVGTRQGSTVMFVSKEHDRPMPFKAPSWAKKITEADLKHRNISRDNLGCGYWWIELGGVYDAIRDTDKLRFELLAVVMGVWDYIKNSGKFPEAANRAIENIGMLPGRRDTLRVVGDYVMTQHDIEGGWKNFDDAIAMGGWSMDDHPKEGFYATDKTPCRQDGRIPFYNIPLGVTCAKGIENLMMAGRNISCSHVAFTSTRVMCTCAAVGQAVGTAAAMCVEHGISPKKLRADKTLVKELQQKLLRDDQSIYGVKNEDPADLARLAKVTASNATEGSKPENVISGVTIDPPNVNENRWLAPVAEKPWIKLEWDSPQKISSVRLTFDSWYANLTQSSSDYQLRGMHRGPEPRIMRDYILTATDPSGNEKILADVSGNFQKLAVHNFDPVTAKSIKLQILASNGAITARVKEIRVEA